MRLLLISSLIAAGLAAGCARDDYQRVDGLTTGAGDAIASNSAMQMVDPWQNGVQNTRLLVPSQRPATQGGSADDAASAKDSQTTTTSD